MPGSRNSRAMFEDFGTYQIVLVTGPQRSGTRITAKMIAHDTGHTYIDEDKIACDSLYKLAILIENARKNARAIVVQCPALCHVVHEFSCSDILVVMCVRKEEDIIASQKRINWEWEYIEQMNYPFQVLDHWPICRVKYAWWHTHQRIACGEHWTEVYYDQLSEHPLWVPKERRVNFRFNQTTETELCEATEVEAGPDTGWIMVTLDGRVLKHCLAASTSGWADVALTSANGTLHTEGEEPREIRVHGKIELWSIKGKDVVFGEDEALRVAEDEFYWVMDSGNLEEVGEQYAWIDGEMRKLEDE